jgi:hypothetical protein
MAHDRERYASQGFDESWPAIETQPHTLAENPTYTRC